LDVTSAVKSASVELVADRNDIGQAVLPNSVAVSANELGGSLDFLHFDIKLLMAEMALESGYEMLGIIYGSPPTAVGRGLQPSTRSVPR
jgi:hypothetical protein